MVDIAEERIAILFREADRAAVRGRVDLADRYVRLAREVGMRYNVTVPTHMRRRACRGCHGYLLPGVNCRVRLNRGRASISCLRCGHVTRIPLARPATAGARAPGARPRGAGRDASAGDAEEGTGGEG
jgi:ribonuclease P protein subunit RPR2